MSSSSTNGSSTSSGNLSSRGKGNAAMMDEKFQRLLKVFRNLYDPDNNPEGIISFGVADNALMRPDLLQYFNHNRLSLFPGELTYGDRIFTSARLLDALSNLFNNIPDGIPNGKPSKELPFGGKGPKNIHPVEPEHIIIGTGASGILDSLFWTLCDIGDGILLSTPYYNGFDGDSGIRSGAKIVPVNIPEPKSDGSKDHLEVGTLNYYEDVIEKSKKDGIDCKVLLICNPHNPTGGIYPRETIIEFCKFASKHSLHLIVDEIYARSIFQTSDVSNPETFHSILTVDVEKEANLDPSRVSVVTSASKDFSVNGFRLGVAVIQHNEELRRAMSTLGILNQSSSPAGALWYTWLNDTPFLSWYLRENRRRLSLSYNYVTEWFKHFQIPYVPSTSGHYFLCDLSNFLDEKIKDKREAENILSGKFLEEKVFIAPGSQYHHPIPGWFRFTFTTNPKAIKEGLKRIEKILGLEEFSSIRELLDLDIGAEKCPISYDDDEKVGNQLQRMDLRISSKDDDEEDSMRKSWEDDKSEKELVEGNEKESGKKSLLSKMTCGMI